MQSIAINIPGNFWDSQIYRGKLFLFGRDGSIRTIDWDRLISEIHIPKRLNLALTCAFQRSDYFYGRNWDLFFTDPEIKRLVTKKFEDLSSKEIYITDSQLRESEFGIQDNPLSFPHADSIIYNKNFYVVGDTGVWRATCNPRKSKNAVSSRPSRQWDCPTISVAAAYGALALSAGHYGLWELSLGMEYYTSPFNAIGRDGSNALQLAKQDCDSCEFMYHSIYGSSYSAGGFLAEFTRSDADSSGQFTRTFSKIFGDQEIFGKNKGGYSWGTRDKIYLAIGNKVKIVRYAPYDEHNHLQIIGDVDILAWKGEFVSGGVATFGAILEYDNAIVVFPSAGNSVTIPGEPIRWRVFPNSHFYQNQLHIIYDDKIQIRSFNQDYFVDQKSKKFGSRAIEQNRWRGNR